jgi:hypothetical protein
MLTQVADVNVDITASPDSGLLGSGFTVKVDM